MTHDELLQKIKDEFFFTQGLGTVLHHNSCSSSPCHCGEIDRTHKRLRDTMLAVVELHKPTEPVENSYTKQVWIYCEICLEDLEDYATNLIYPCPTIQAIEVAIARGQK